MAVLRAKVKGRDVTVELTIDELQDLLERQVFLSRRKRPVPLAHVQPDLSASETAARASEDLAGAIRRAWPGGMDLVDNPELTTGNVRRFLIQRVLAGELTTSTGDVAIRFFSRPLSPASPADSANLRRLWYCVRSAKRDIEEAVGGRWVNATDAPVRAGTSRAWRFVRAGEDDQPPTLAYREAR